MKRLTPAAFAVALAAVAALPVRAQSQRPAPAIPAEPRPPAAETPIEVTAAPYAYEVAGRRDPFRSLLVRNAAEKDRARPAGLAGVMVEELELQGTIKTKAGWIAMMRASDNRSHLIRKGTVLFDGEVTDITGNDVTFRQNVNDPTNPKPFREVTKALTLQKK